MDQVDYADIRTELAKYVPPGHPDWELSQDGLTAWHRRKDRAVTFDEDPAKRGTPWILMKRSTCEAFFWSSDLPTALAARGF